VRERVRILGIDPGLGVTGWGVIEQQGSNLSFVACGTLSSPATLSLPERLCRLSTALASLITEHRPDESAMEDSFVNVNAATSLKLGQARGALLLTLAQAGLLIGEYPPRQVKKTVTGVGSAEKAQVAAMVKMLLPAAREPLDSAKMDASDALAVAICHANHRQFLSATRLTKESV
jgi:crossover junction endodeoxyribonuclease RuvC